MRTVSNRWAAGVANPHGLGLRVTVLPDEVDLETVVEGVVSLDAAAASRGRLDLTVVDDGTLLPRTSEDLLTPYGNEIQVRRGIIYPDGIEELVSIGIFRIESVEVEESADTLLIKVAGLDRSARIIDARFEDVYPVASGSLLTTVIDNVVTSAYPDVTKLFAVSDATASKASALEADDRWEFCQRVATAAGMELYFDGDGALVLRPTPTAAAGSPVAELIEGEDGILITDFKDWSREGTYNRVIVAGDGTDSGAPVPRGVATDDDAFSPTFFYGKFGQKPRFYSSKFIKTNDQASTAAAAILAGELGITQRINFASVVNPALEPGDVVRVRRERSNIDEDHVIETLNIPLRAEQEMSGTTRATKVIA